MKLGKQRSTSQADKVLGQKIRTRRMLAKMSQSGLGDALGVSFQQVQKYEKGVNRISTSRLCQIATCLGESIHYFIDGAQDKVTPEAANLATLMTDRQCIRLVKAFAKIADPDLQHRTLTLVEGIALNTKGSKR
jgi:transcriptional regulator with XRE-family HTH domain